MALHDLGRIDAVLAEIAELNEGFPGAWLGTLPAFGTRGWTTCIWRDCARPECARAEI
jgi:hypothetical protein